MNQTTYAENLVAQYGISATSNIPGSPGERFNDWGGRGYDDFVPGEVTKTAPSGDETT